MPPARDAGRITRSQTGGRLSTISNNAGNRRREVSGRGVRLRTSALHSLDLLDQLMANAHVLATRSTGRRSTRERRGTQEGSTSALSSSSPEPTLIDNTIMIATPPERNVQVVDLDSWNPPSSTGTTVNRTRRPLEVDLTCELDDEVFVVLEDIINPSRRSSVISLPVELENSSTRTASNATASTRRNPTVSMAEIGSTTTATSTSSTSASNCLNSSDASKIKENESLKASTSTTDGAASLSTSDFATGIQCPICLDSLPQMKAANHQLQSTICGHLFCHPCIVRVISNTKQCPTCRQSLTVKKIHPIFI